MKRLWITSTQNPRIKQVVRLRDRPERERTGLIIVEGADELELALNSGLHPQTIFVCPELAGPAERKAILERAHQAGAEWIEIPPAIFTKIAYRENPDGWLAVVPFPHRGLDSLENSLGAAPLLVIAEAVEKPGNLGAILRTADAAGANGLILCDPTTDPGNPNVVRSSRGTLFSVPIAEADSQATLAWLRRHGISIVAATPHASREYTQADLRGPVAIAVGEEKHGLSRLWLDQADIAVRIPMCGRVNSLNVATAAALVIYEAVRQRRLASGANST